MITADILKRLAALNLSAECHTEILRILVSVVEPIEEKRKKDRERKRAVRGMSAGKSEDMHIYNTTKKVSKRSKYISAAEVAESPQEDNRAYAASKGWDHNRILSEWQRFRDHGIAKGKTHRNVAAAWRNWVTSPYQTGPSNGKTTGNGLSQALAKLRDNIRETEGSEEGGGEIVRLLPRGGRQ